MSSESAVLVTGASTGIGAVYAERFARRGHDLVLVARNHERLTALAERLRDETGVQVDILQADLTQDSDIAAVEQRLREDARIRILVNNAGTSIPGDFLHQSSDDITRLITLNVTCGSPGERDRAASGTGRRGGDCQHCVGRWAGSGNGVDRLRRHESLCAVSLAGARR